MKIIKNKTTGEVLNSLPKLVNTNIEGIIVIDIQSKIWLITNNTALDVTNQFDILEEEPEEVVVINKCSLSLTFNSPSSVELENDYNIIKISVLGNSIHLVEFKSSLEDWKTPTGNNLNNIIIKVPASGNKEAIKARIKGCTTEIKYDVQTIKKLEPIIEEIEVGTIKFSESKIFKFVIKKTDNTTWLLQTDAERSYYLPRGLNILKDSRVTIDKSKFVESELSNDKITNSGGLQPFINDVVPARWPRNWWESRGYTQKTNGDWSLSTENPIVIPPVVIPPIVIPPITIPPNNGNKFTVDVGVINWDNWERDYWADPDASEDDLNRNHIGLNRVAASEWKHKFKTVPFFGQYTAPEVIKIRNNVRWNDDLGRNEYDEFEKTVSVKFDKTPADTDREIKYYADAGFSWICFNYYSDVSYLSNTRRQFVAMSNKYGMKMTFMLADKREDSEVNYIANLMMQDYWFKIDGKPVLYFDNSDYLEIDRYKSAYRNAGGGEIYDVYYTMTGLPQDVNDLFSKRPKAVSAYANTTSYGRTARDLMRSEVEDRQNFLNQFSASNISVIPNLTTGFEQLGLRTSVADQGVPGSEAATLQEIAEKCSLAIEFINKSNKDKMQVPAILWYAGNEILESGNPIIPTKREDGSIDTSMLDTISTFLK